MTINYTPEGILRQVIEGDPVAFARLYRHYRTPAIRFCTSLLKDPDDAENMVQDMFIKLWERRATINPELNFNAFLFTCLRNLAFDHLKQVEKSQVLRQRYMERMQALHDETHDDQDARFQVLQTAINSLSEKRKLILRMNVEGGKSYQEIAEVLRISKNTVKNQLVKAKQVLRNQLDLALF